MLGSDGGSGKQNPLLFTQSLTDIPPLRFQFHKNDLTLQVNNEVILSRWVETVKNNDVAIFIKSYSALPTGLRDQTPDSARHKAIRMAFSRSLVIRNLLEKKGINRDRINIRALVADTDPKKEQQTSSEYVILTIRQD